MVAYIIPSQMGGLSFENPGPTKLYNMFNMDFTNFRHNT